MLASGLRVYVAQVGLEVRELHVDVVVTEHVETWFWSEEQSVALPFVSVHEFRDERIARWSDYWDMQKFVGQFPDWFLEEMMKSTADDFTD